jgi:hypothetical protein
VIKHHISQDKLDTFMEVAEKINELIAERQIFASEDKK